jgi:hypothetical protein
LLAQALAVWGRAAAATTNHGDRAAFLNNFAYALRFSYELTGEPDELPQAMDACTAAVSLAEPGAYLGRVQPYRRLIAVRSGHAPV